MAKTYNGWTALYSVPNTYFTAPNGKRVYCNNESVATIFEYVAQQWNDRIEKLPKATYNIGDPKVRTGYIVIHSYRAPNRHIGTGNMSNHRSATGMDILGDRHPYEATNPPHLKGSGYNDGFSTRQRNELIKIRNEIGRNSRGMWILRLGIHFPIGKRDGMHVEIAPGITSLDVKAAAARLRAEKGVEDLTKVHTMLSNLGYSANTAGVKEYQQDRGLVVDGIPGSRTIKALEEDMTTIRDLEKKIDNLPQNVWGYRHPKYANNRDAHGLLRDGDNSKDIAANKGLLDKIVKQVNTVGRVASEARELARSVPERVIAARVPFIKGTSAHKTFGDSFRFGALLAYAAQAFYRRDEQTQEIVEGVVEQIDVPQLESEMHAQAQNEEA